VLNEKSSTKCIYWFHRDGYKEKLLVQRTCS
jgi:hypothetical protein